MPVLLEDAMPVLLEDMENPAFLLFAPCVLRILCYDERRRSEERSMPPMKRSSFAGYYYALFWISRA